MRLSGDPRVAVWLAALLLALASLLPVYAQEVDAVALVESVVDGDTIVVVIVESRTGLVSEGSRERVRLADINAPELGTPEGEKSRLYLEGMLRGARVFLDIDDVGVRDRYGRLVAVVYLRVNDTCVLNVNHHLVRAGYAALWDHDNEFDPREWVECLPELDGGATGDAGFTHIAGAVIAGALLALAVAAALLLARRRERGGSSGRRRYKPQPAGLKGA